MNETRVVLLETMQNVLDDVDIVGVDDQTSLKELGANSIDRVDILIRTMNTLSIRIDLMEFKDARSFGEIAEVLDANRS